MTKKVWKYYQSVGKTAEKAFHRIEQHGSYVFIGLFREPFENRNGNMNRRRNLEAVSSAYVSVLSARLYGKVEEIDCLSIEDAAGSYFDTAVATTSSYEL